METQIVLFIAAVVIIAGWFVMTRSQRSGVVEGDEPQEVTSIIITEEDVSVYTKNQLVILVLKLDPDADERFVSRQTKPKLKALLVGQTAPADFFEL
jgi:hypothetical protein